MKKPQWITIAVAALLVAAIYGFGRIVPKPSLTTTENQQHSPGDGHDHAITELSSDSIMVMAKRQLSEVQALRINMLENSISRGDVKNQQLRIFHQLSHFWKDSARIFEPYAWYEAEAARLENSEKTLTFAAHLFLENLQQEQDPSLARWKALQAKDLFERSLKINPGNDSSRVGLGATYLFGHIAENPMQGISMIRQVVEKDSNFVFGQMVLAKGSMLSAQYDKAISRLMTVNRIQPGNLEALLLLADLHERKREKDHAVYWYRESLRYINRADARAEIEKRINELGK